MQNKMVRIFYIYILICLLAPAAVMAAGEGIAKKLSPGELNRIEQGELVYKEENVEGSVWPERKIYTVIPVEPVEAAAVFADYEYQKEYIPDMVEAKVIRQDSPTEIVVSYIVEMPWPVVNEEFTNSHTIKTYREDGGDGYLIAWEQLDGSSAENSHGSARFEPYDKGKCIMEYTSFIQPKSALAGLGFIEKKGKENLKNSVNALIDEIIEVRRNKTNLLLEQLQRLHAALDGTYVY
jgi:hypothetical protein